VARLLSERPGLLGAQVLGGLVDGGGSGGRALHDARKRSMVTCQSASVLGEAGDEGSTPVLQRGVCYLVGDLDVAVISVPMSEVYCL